MRLFANKNRNAGAIATLASAGLLALLPMPAFANFILGTVVLVPELIYGFLPVMLMEMLILAPTLRVSMRRAWTLSLRVNLLSTFLGLVVATPVMFMNVNLVPDRMTAYGWLVAFFLSSWLIEYWRAARIAPDLSRLRLCAATGTANLVSYLGIALAVWFIYPAHALSPATRYHLMSAIYATDPLRKAVSAFQDARKRFPDNLAELDKKAIEQASSGYFNYDLALEKNGRIVMKFRGMNALVDGKRIELEPRPYPVYPKSQWFCSSPDIEPRSLPHNCQGAVP